MQPSRKTARFIAGRASAARFLPFAFAAFAAVAPAVHADAPDASGAAAIRSFDITFSGYAGSGALTDFPVLVRLSPALNGFDYSRCRTDGSDIRFIDASGNPLAREIDTWTPGGESLVWVKVPSLTASTKITCLYGFAGAAPGSASDVWSNGYAGVWHMNETARPMLDSTTNGINFTRSYAYTPADKFDEFISFAQEGGAVGRAVAFTPAAVDDGKSNQGGLLAPDPDGKLCGLDAMTIEIWAKTDTFDATRYLIGRRMANKVDGIKVRGYEFQYSANRKFTATFYLENGARDDNDKCSSTTGAMSTSLVGQWNYHCASYDRSASSHPNFLNDVVAVTVGNDTGYPIHSVVSDPLCLANDCNPGQERVFNGSLDELRISNVARSADWVKATYDTIKDHDTFTTYTAAHENRRGMLIIFW